MEKSSYRNCNTCAKKDCCDNRLNCLHGVIPLLWEPGANYEPLHRDESGLPNGEKHLAERPLDVTKLDDEQLNAELEKGFADIAAGRSRLASQVFNKKS